MRAGKTACVLGDKQGASSAVRTAGGMPPLGMAHQSLASCIVSHVTAGVVDTARSDGCRSATTPVAGQLTACPMHTCNASI